MGLEGHKLNYAIRFDFQSSKNATECDTLLPSLRFSKEMQIRWLLVSCDLQLVVSQVKGNFAARDKNMASYLKNVMELLLYFEKFELTRILRIENTHVDALLKLASGKDLELLKAILIEHLPRPSISKGDEVMWIEGIPLWIQPIVIYL